MQNLAAIVPLVILFPAIGTFINAFLGARIGEKWVATMAIIASSLAFGVAIVLYAHLSGNGYAAAVVNPPLLDGWVRIPSVGVEIPWQMRVDTLSVTMMLVVTGVGTLIHIYAAGYMHGDPRYHWFFAYLNMFLSFMLILVTGNNLLMMFVGWEGVGLCSFLLIGFWFDKTKGVGWRNSNAARKAFIVNRIGDFGLLMGIFLTFWTFGTLDFYKPGEIANVHLAEEMAAEHAEATMGDKTEAEPAHKVAAQGGEEGHGAAAAAEGEEVEHAEEAAQPVYTNNNHIPDDQLGIFGQAERMIAANVDVDFGPFTLPIGAVIGWITFFMLLGATGKSAQIPLFVWLPDAMAGPTPVSALIHAATMVTAGVYMMVRANVFFHHAELTSLLVALIGMATALVGGFIALGQWDIKRVLAYSTVSQLGFMVAAVGVGAYGAAMFHLVTHAFFKALLFLGSGSVIHGVEHGHHHAHAHAAHGHDAHGDEHHEEEEFDPQDMRNMGGLRERMPVTYWTYVIGTLALAGIFPFAGFWSKDEILADSWLAGLFGETMAKNVGGYVALGGLVLAAAFTAFYMWRQVEMVFHGEARTEAAKHAPESVATMTIPLVVLAFFSVIAGFFNVPTGLLGLDGIFGAHRFTYWLEHSVANAHAADFNPIIAILALGLAIFAIYTARNVYGFNRALTRNNRDPLQVDPTMGPIWSLSNARLYWDETYYRLFENPFNKISVFLAESLDWAFWHDFFHNTILRDGFNTIGRLLSQSIDLGIIDAAVLRLGSLVRAISGRLRGVQTGYVRTYAVSFLVGVVLIIIILLFPLIQQTLAAGGQ